MRETIQNIRNKFIIEIWQTYKGTITMQELADMFSITLQHCYRILKVVNKPK